jgi:hypothetical protein
MTPKKWRITSLETVWYEGWYIKPSVSTLDSFCVVMYNEHTDESVIGFATDEMEANRFIECVVESGKSLES